MTLASIAWKSIQQRGLASSLTSLSIALGVMLMVTVLVIYGIIAATFSQRSINYDLIVGPKGSDLQLILSTVYHVAPPIENLPYKYYLQLKDEPGVEAAVPVAFGDVTEDGGFPIVGTINQFFQIDYAPKRPFLIQGRYFANDFEAVIGARVARENGWKIGDSFRMIHGSADTGHVHDERFEIVGLLAPTGTPHDKCVYVNLEGFYKIQGHDKPLDEAIAREREFFDQPPLSPEEMQAEIKRVKRVYRIHDHSQDAGGGHEHHDHDTPDLQKDVTSVLLSFKTAPAAFLFAGRMKKGFKAMAVNPVIPMQKLMNDVFGPVRTLLLILTALIILVSGIGVLVSIYNSMADRRREIAIMRALGASRGSVFSIILLESLLLCLGGGILGLLMGHGLVYLAAPIVEARIGMPINPFSFDPIELALFPILAVLAALVGLLPGLAAYNTDVSSGLNG